MKNKAIIYIPIILLIVSILVKYKNNLYGYFNNKNINRTEIFVVNDEIKIGTVAATDVANANFTFINTGHHPLVIDRIETSCHCTQGVVSFMPTEPGDSTSVEIIYDKNQKGFFYQDIRVYGNFENSPVFLSFSGIVE
ncbi:DUF1573 domain-containing protein [Algoriphagus sp. D3-2-R+10]|uniref:DUF1573 domain-containing protein n=1 Tax=Algoriphagus aurantiacus TaxID=3103948 RepID=UPI002B3718CF|nr:DUF1573 domain-containing protein [Algoriphagus sp. D3-2-R+10]MEB2776491.1 DUF1573 domain-containing protein [Algoriphagus sp. D3-2-R+10]